MSQSVAYLGTGGPLDFIKSKLSPLPFPFPLSPSSPSLPLAPTPSIAYVVTVTEKLFLIYFAWNSGTHALAGPLAFAHPAHPIATPLVTVTNTAESFTHKMAAKTSWHGYMERNYATVTLCI